MTAKLELSGQRFGRLLVVSLAGSDRFGKSQWNCLCDCGKSHVAGSRTLKSGHTRSCGCYREERRKTYRPPHDKKPEDLSGKRFGNWRVMELTGARTGSGKPLFRCECDCGTVSSLSGAMLKSGQSKSCGCRKGEAVRLKRIVSGDGLAGHRFGRWTVIRYLPERFRLECRCQCGTVAEVVPADLKNGKSVSCGCYRRERAAEVKMVDLSGKRSGKLLALHRAASVKPSGRSYVVWACLCDCGNKKDVRAETFSSGRVISCGCERNARKKGRIPYLPEQVRAKTAARGNARRAKKARAGGTFTTTQIEDLRRKQRGRCAACAGTLGASFHRDHIVPLALGGHNGIDNIQLLCVACNSRKGAKDPIRWANERGLLL